MCRVRGKFRFNNFSNLYIIAKEYQKTIATLKNPKAALIKKRQLMRITLGDYRLKMANDDKKIQFGKLLVTYFNNSVIIGNVQNFNKGGGSANRILHHSQLILASNVKVGDCERAKKSTYLKMKQCKSYNTKNTFTSYKSSHIHCSGPPYTSNMSNDLIHMLKTSGLEDKNNQPKSTEFKFNFDISKQEPPIEQTVPNKLHSDLSTYTSSCNPVQLKNLNYKPSDNTFRFDFSTS